MQGMITELIKETGMEEDDSKKLQDTLLKAEKKSQKFLRRTRMKLSS
jgi:hypothetical protein